MALTRRSFLLAAASLSMHRSWASRSVRFKIGVPDWSLGLRSQPEAVALAQKLGFDGIEVGLGRKVVDGRLEFENHEIQARYLAESRKYQIPIAGVAVNMLSVNFLKSDKLAPEWITQAIPIAARLNARVLLLPFFGKAVLETASDMNYAADRLKEIAPSAERAGVCLGLENTLSAEDNARILDRVASDVIRVYYDVGNSTAGGFDVVKEIRWLGKDRICQVHLKDDPKLYLGEGKIDFRAVLITLIDIGYEGFANLETAAPSGSVETDMRRNLAYIRSTLKDVSS